MATELAVKSFQHFVVEPPDFDTFWDSIKAGLKTLPLEPELTPAPLRCTPEALVYEVHYTSLGELRVAGWYVVPRRGSGPFPALIHFPGYQGEPRLIRNWAERGVISLTVAYRGKLRAHKQFNPGYPGFLTHGIESKETYAYSGVFSDAMRGVDFLLSRPEVDPQRVFAHGSSQGGGLTIVTTSLRQEIKGGVAGCPFLCAFGDAMKLTRSYPYNELNCYMRAYPDRKEQILNTLSYFDAVNFAKRIDRPMAIQMGMEDDVCPPQTCYAAYRELKGEKEAWMLPKTGHGTFPGYAQMTTRWLEEQTHIGLTKGRL